MQINVYAQDVPPITLHVDKAGTLSTLIAANRKYEITDLTLTGNLNGTDIRFIREMAGRDVGGKVTNGKLAKLNLADANIVAGGNYYYSYATTQYIYCYTSTNEISFRMFYECTGLTDVTIPNSVTSIGNTAFYRCTGLTNVTIPNSVTSIGNNAFDGCTGLINLTIGNSVNSIGSYAFSGCTGLTNVTIPNSVTTIGNNAFYRCTGLINLTIGNSVNSIGSYAFSGCTGLTNVTIPNSVTTIGGYAFYVCTGLTSVTIGNSVTSIGSYAFRGCKELKEFIVLEQNQNYSSNEGVLFNKEKTTIVQYPESKQGSYAIPNSVTSIGSYAFYECKGLTKVTIGNSVTSIGSYAFGYCTGLTSITIPNSVTSIVDYAFSDCTGLTEIHCKNPQPITIDTGVFSRVNKTTCELYVPKGSYTAYWLAYVWSAFKNIIEEDATAIQAINKDIASVHSISNGIYIDTKETASIVVYNLSGQTVYQDVVNGSTEITLDKGVYIVRVNNESQKVIVK